MVFAPRTPYSRGMIRPRNFKALPSALRAGSMGSQGLINMELNEIRGLFFNKRAIDQAVDRAAYLANSRAAAYLRTTARRSMKWRGPFSTKESIRPKAKKEAYIAARRRWHQSGKKGPEPKLPYPTSKPGQPPFARRRNGQLRRFLFSVVLKDSRSAIIGPVKLQGRRATVPKLHEYGGLGLLGKSKQVKVFPPRPYMAPAKNKTIPLMPQFWKGKVKKR